MHSVLMPSFRKFSLTSFLNLVTILLHDMLGLMKLLFLQFSDHLLPRRHKALQNLETAPLQIDFEHIFFSSQTIDVAIIRSNLTLTRVCSQSQQKTFIQSCLVVTFSLLILSCNLELCVQFAYTCYILYHLHANIGQSDS